MRGPEIEGQAESERLPFPKVQLGAATCPKKGWTPDSEGHRPAKIRLFLHSTCMECSANADFRASAELPKGILKGQHH